MVSRDGENTSGIYYSMRSQDRAPANESDKFNETIKHVLCNYEAPSRSRRHRQNKQFKACMNPAHSPICRRVELMSAGQSNYVAYAFEKKKLRRLFHVTRPITVKYLMFSLPALWKSNVLRNVIPVRVVFLLSLDRV